MHACIYTYAVIEREREGERARERGNRTDKPKRDPSGLLAVSDLGLPRHFLDYSTAQASLWLWGGKEGYSPEPHVVTAA